MRLASQIKNHFVVGIELPTQLQDELEGQSLTELQQLQLELGIFCLHSMSFLSHEDLIILNGILLKVARLVGPYGSQRDTW